MHCNYNAPTNGSTPQISTGIKIVFERRKCCDFARFEHLVFFLTAYRRTHKEAPLPHITIVDSLVLSLDVADQLCDEFRKDPKAYLEENITVLFTDDMRALFLDYLRELEEDAGDAPPPACIYLDGPHEESWEVMNFYREIRNLCFPERGMLN